MEEFTPRTPRDKWRMSNHCKYVQEMTDKIHYLVIQYSRAIRYEDNHRRRKIQKRISRRLERFREHLDSNEKVLRDMHEFDKHYKRENSNRKVTEEESGEETRRTRRLEEESDSSEESF